MITRSAGPHARVKDRAERPQDKCEHACVCSAWLIAHDVRLVAQDRRKRCENSLRENRSFAFGISVRPLAVQRLPYPASDQSFYKRPDGSRRHIEERGRAAL